MEEAKIKEEITIAKPEPMEEIKAEIKGISKIENNIEQAKNYAIDLKKYYESIEFTEEIKKDVEKERADINKQKKLVADFRKKIVAEYNKPIENFESMAKETEKILGETADFITSQVSVFDEKKKKEAEEKIRLFFDEYSLSKEIDFVKFEDLGIKIGLNALTEKGSITKKIQDQITSFLDNVEKELQLINTLEFKDEILVEYKKTLKCASAIADVQDRHRQLEEMQKQKEEKTEETLTDKTVQERISHVTAPKVEEKKYSMTFTVTGTMARLKELKEYLKKEGFISE